MQKGRVATYGSTRVRVKTFLGLKALLFQGADFVHKASASTVFVRQRLEPLTLGIDPYKLDLLLWENNPRRRVRGRWDITHGLGPVQGGRRVVFWVLPVPIEKAGHPVAQPCPRALPVPFLYLYLAPEPCLELIGLKLFRVRVGWLLRYVLDRLSLFVLPVQVKEGQGPYVTEVLWRMAGDFEVRNTSRGVFVNPFSVLVKPEGIVVRPAYAGMAVEGLKGGVHGAPPRLHEGVPLDKEFRKDVLVQPFSIVSLEHGVPFWVWPSFGRSIPFPFAVRCVFGELQHFFMVLQGFSAVQGLCPVHATIPAPGPESPA